LRAIALKCRHQVRLPVLGSLTFLRCAVHLESENGKMRLFREKTASDLIFFAFSCTINNGFVCADFRDSFLIKGGRDGTIPAAPIKTNAVPPIALTPESRAAGDSLCGGTQEDHQHDNDQSLDPFG
jgi:hypothetical protein